MKRRQLSAPWLLREKGGEKKGMDGLTQRGKKVEYHMTREGNRRGEESEIKGEF